MFVGYGVCVEVPGAHADLCDLAVVVIWRRLGRRGGERWKTYAKANNIELVWNSANNDVSTQVGQVDSLINRASMRSLSFPHRRIRSVRRWPRPSQRNLAGGQRGPEQPRSRGQCATSRFAAGAQEMPQMADKLRGRGNIVILQGPLGGSGEINRGKGIAPVLWPVPNDDPTWALISCRLIQACACRVAPVMS